MKQCKKCSEKKPLSNFYRNGLYYGLYCKECQKEYAKHNPHTLSRAERRQLHHSSLESMRRSDREYQRRRRANNPQWKLEQNRRYQQNDRQKIAAEQLLNY